MKINASFLLRPIAAVLFFASCTNNNGNNGSDGGSSGEIQVTAIYLDAKERQMQIDQRQRLISQISPNDADNQDIVWTSSNAQVATVTEGLVIALKEGEAVITARVKGTDISAECKVVIVPSINYNTLRVTDPTDEKGTVQFASLNIEPNQTPRIDLSIGDLRSLELPRNPNPLELDPAVVWRSDNEKVVTVSSRGMLHAEGEGTANVTMTFFGTDREISIAVTVKGTAANQPTTSDADGVFIKDDRGQIVQSISMVVGDSRALTAVVEPVAEVDQTVVWSIIDDPLGVISITTDGFINASQNPGVARIRATSRRYNKYVDCEISVTRPSIDVAAINFKGRQPPYIIYTEADGPGRQTSLQYSALGVEILPVDASDPLVKIVLVSNRTADRSNRVVELNGLNILASNEGTAKVRYETSNSQVSKEIDVQVINNKKVQSIITKNGAVELPLPRGASKRELRMGIGRKVTLTIEYTPSDASADNKKLDASIANTLVAISDIPDPDGNTIEVSSLTQGQTDLTIRACQTCPTPVVQVISVIVQ